MYIDSSILLGFKKMFGGGQLNLYEVPLRALRHTARQIIAHSLDKRKVIPSSKGYPRDWRGLADLAGLTSLCGKTLVLLREWSKEDYPTLGLLLQFLEELDRWDVKDDIQQLVREDAQFYLRRVNEGAEEPRPINEIDTRILTIDDVRRLQKKLTLEPYHAMMVYADPDVEFAKEMLEQLESNFQFRVALKENLVGGAFESEGVIDLISRRCSRVIIILSRNFFNSSMNRFCVAFAQALAIEKRKRIIIPCVYDIAEMELPQEIRLLHKLDYNRSSLIGYNFWEKLRNSIVASNSQPALQVLRPLEYQPIRNRNTEPDNNGGNDDGNAIVPGKEPPKRSNSGSTISETEKFDKSKSSRFKTLKNIFKRKKKQRPLAERAG